MIKKQGTPTGTIRRKRFDEQTKDWLDCWHCCPDCELKSKDVLSRKKDKVFLDSFQFYGHKTWSHKVSAEAKCHLPVFFTCESCLTFPDWLKDFHYK